MFVRGGYVQSRRIVPTTKTVIKIHSISTFVGLESGVAENLELKAR